MQIARIRVAVMTVGAFVRHLAFEAERGEAAVSSGDGTFCELLLREKIAWALFMFDRFLILRNRREWFMIAAPLVIAGVALLLNGVLLVFFLRGLNASVETMRSALEYDERCFESLRDDELVKTTRDYFDTVSVKLTAMGFELIGNYRIETSPETVVRYFISHDRRVFAEVVDMAPSRFRRRQALELASVLADGTYLNTADVRLRGFSSHPGHPDLVQLLGIPGTSICELYQRHEQRLEHHSASGDNPPLEFEAEDFRDVSNYLHQLFAWRRRLDEGIESEPPELAQAQARRGSKDPA